MFCDVQLIICYKLINENSKLFYNIFIINIKSAFVVLFALNNKIFDVIKV